MFDLLGFSKKFLYLFIFLIIVFSLFSPEIQRKPVKLLSLPVGTAVYYVQLGSSSVFQGLGQIWDRYINLVGVQMENERLHSRITVLEGDNRRLSEKVILSERLKVLLDYKEHSQVDMITAAVIGRKPSQWFDTIMINKGSLEGIEIDMGVVVPQGVVGKVIDSGPHYAQVLLVSDRNSAIGATVQRTRDEGIAQGVDAYSVHLKYLPHDSKVAIGDLLVTSGMEGSFTKGIKIGQVEDIKRKKGEMFLKIKATLGTDLRKVEEVLVIRSIENEELP